MADKLDRFTQGAQRAFMLAQEEALRLHHDYIGVEHLLLGIVRQYTGPVVEALLEQLVRPDQVIRAVERSVDLGQSPPGTKPLLTDQAKQTIITTVQEAGLLGADDIGVEHLFLAMLREEDGYVAKLLRGLAVDLGRARSQLLHLIVHAQGQERAGYQRSRPVALFEDLTAAADAGKLDPLVGRQRELEHLIQILGRRTKQNALLVGEAGVGKRALIRGLAQRISEGQVPLALMPRALYALDGVTADSSVLYREREFERLQRVISRCIANHALLYVNKIHTWIAAAGTNVEAATRLQLAVSRGELQVIGATTPAQYARFVGPEAASEWSLQSIQISEPSPEEAVEILRGLKRLYEQHHRVHLQDEALVAAVQLSVDHRAHGFLPTKALDLIDAAASRVQMQRTQATDELRPTLLALAAVKREKRKALEAQREDEVLALRQREQELEAALDEFHGQPAAVTPAEIAAVVSLWSGKNDSQADA